MQLYIPTAGGGRTEVLRRHHDDPIARHFGTNCTLGLVLRKYNWPGISHLVELLPQPCGPWTNILMDFIVGLLGSHQKRNAKPYNTILLVVNQFTKQAHYFPCHDLLDAIGLGEIHARKLVL